MQQDDSKLIDWKHPVTFFSVVLVLYGILFLPFWKPILLGFLFACACAPTMNRMRRKLHGRRTTLAYLTVGLMIFLFLLILIVLGLKVYTLSADLFEKPEALNSKLDQLSGAKDRIATWIESSALPGSDVIREQLDQGLKSAAPKVRDFILGAAKSFATSAPQFFLMIFIFVLAFALFLAAGPKTWKLLQKVRPIEESRFQEFEQICSLSIWSTILTGLVQSTLVVVGCAIAGYSDLLIIFVLTFFLSMIPVLGAGMVPFVLGVLSLTEGNSGPFAILLVTALIAGTADNFLRAYMFSKAAESNPVISLIALLGAITLFGFPGLFISPVLEQLVMQRLRERGI